MSSLVKPENTKQPTEQRKRPAPKRFIFKDPEPALNILESDESIQMITSLSAMDYSPVVFTCSPPKNYKDAYDSVCEHISRVFDEINQLMLSQCAEVIKEVNQGKNVRGPKDCLDMMKDAIIKFGEKIQKTVPKGKSSKEDNAYEKLLQKAEGKIRDLIRNEQIYRISFDQYTYRHEENEKIVNELHYKLKDKRAKIELLMQENQKLTSMLQSKDEEIRSFVEGQSPMSNPNIMTPHADSPLSPDHHSARLRSINIQNLKGLLNNNHAESSGMTPETAGSLNNFKLSARASSPSVKTKGAERSGKSRSSGTNFLSLKINTLDKTKDRDLSKHRLEILSDRRKLDNSAEHKGNSTERLLDSFNFNLRKAPSIQLLAEQPKAKPNPRKLVRHETLAEEKSKTMINSARLRPYDDSAAVLFKMEASEDYESYSATLSKTDKKKREDQAKLQSKREEYQLLNSSRARKSGTSKIRPLMTEIDADSDDKSPKLKNIMWKDRQPAYGLNHKNSSKERSPKVDSKDPKTPQSSNNVFMNIMLKKLNGQKTTKKGY